ncbi:MAG: pyridoxal phosphate-dependent aminotransferase [Deltaproteobacteria bacterium]|nr:pyridoxal phosphate-dependent aminotransferase [Deltaproteobacteria bacterium]
MTGVPASETLSIAAKVQELKKQGKDVISFTVGEPDFDTPSHIKAAAVEAIEQGFTKYTPGAGIPELRKAVSERIEQDYGLHYDWHQAVVTNGSKQGIYNFFQVVLNPGDEVIIPSPYWVSYPAMVRLAQGKPIFLKTTLKEQFKITPQKLKKAISKRTKIFILNSPSNPTGAFYDPAELEALAEVLEDQNIWILSDDAYAGIVFDGKTFWSIAKYSKKIFQKTFILGTVSKSYAMTGWRVGFVLGPQPKIMEAIEVIQSQSTSGVNSIAQRAALKALTASQDTVKAMVKEFELRRNVALKVISEIPGVRFFTPQGAFYIFADFSSYYGKKYRGQNIKGSIALCEYLLNTGHVALMPGVYFGDDHYLRLSFSLDIQKIETGLERLAQSLKQLE